MRVVRKEPEQAIPIPIFDQVGIAVQGLQDGLSIDRCK